MTGRREFLGALAALFAGVVLPMPVREGIWVPSGVTAADLDRVMKRIFQDPVLFSMRSEFIDFDLDRFKVGLYSSHPERNTFAMALGGPQKVYFDLPRGHGGVI